MSKIAVITDSSCDFTEEYANSLGIDIVPLAVRFGDTDVLQQEDTSIAHFFEMMKGSKVLPKTSQPSPQAFMDAYLKHSDCDDIICVTVTAQSSGTFNSASLAAQMLAEQGFTPRIHVRDTYNASIAIGTTAREAANMAKEGKSIEEILERIEYLRTHLSLYFILETLEYVRKAGRIPAIKAILGEKLRIKPMLTFFKGAPTDVMKIRGMQQAVSSLIERFSQTAENFSHVSIIHTAAKDLALTLGNTLRERFTGIQVETFEVGPVMGTFTGPGGIGLCFVEKNQRFA